MQIESNRDNDKDCLLNSREMSQPEPANRNRYANARNYMCVQSPVSIESKRSRQSSASPASQLNDGAGSESSFELSSVYLWPLAANRNGACKRRRGGEIASVYDDFGKKKRKGIRKGRKGRKRDFGTWNAGEFKLPCSAERRARVCGLSKALVKLARWGPSRQKTSLV